MNALGLVKWLLIGALVLAAVGSMYWFLEKRCNSACVKVTQEWEDDKAARIKRTTEITLELSSKLMASKEDADTLRRKADAKIEPVRTLVQYVPAGARVSLPPAVARVLDNAAVAGNAARSDAADTGAEARADPISSSAAPVEYDAREVAQYLVDAPVAYADAYQQWKAARAREDACYAAINKGASP